MIKIKRFLSTVALTVFVVCFIASAGLSAQEVDRKPVADEMIGAGGITWVTKINYAQLVLTVSRPDGTVFSKTIQSGSTPHVDLGEILGDKYADGSYVYELRVIPFVDKQVRRSGDDGLKKELLPGRSVSQKALTQSGSFWVQGGSIVIPGASETGETIAKPGTGTSTAPEGLDRTSDICYVDDLIVDGSLCVGFDCTCNYSFGFDTIVLKENNLRIFFDDTSAAASFPNNDWRIIINDSANGGSEYFGVEDSTAGRRVFSLEAGAPTHSLYVDDGGRVGFGTSTPVVDLHVKSGNTPTLRLEQDGSSGFTPQTWDVAGNEAGFFVRDATSGSTLPFRIRPGADSQSLVIDSDNDIGIGTLSPGATLDIEDNGNAAILFTNTSASVSGKFTARGDNKIYIGAESDDHPVMIVTKPGGSTLEAIKVQSDGKIYINKSGNAPNVGAANDLEHSNGAALTTGGVWSSVSSRKAKENIKDLTSKEAVETLDGLNPVKYNYKLEKGEEYIGFIAEDVPELVATKDRKRMTAMDVVAVLTKVVQQQQQTISGLNKRIVELEKKVQ